MRHAALWFGAGAEYLDADSLQTHTFLLEKAALSREPCLGTSSEGTEGADAFWSEGATLRISWERKLSMVFEAIPFAPESLRSICTRCVFASSSLSFQQSALSPPSGKLLTFLHNVSSTLGT